MSGSHSHSHSHPHPHPATTPFRNSPSIDALSPHRSQLINPSQSLSRCLLLDLERPPPADALDLHLPSSPDPPLSPDPDPPPPPPPAVAGDPALGTDVPVWLLRSTILSAPSLSSQSTVGPATPHQHHHHHHQTSTEPLHPSQSALAPSWNTSTIAYTPTPVFPPIKHLPGHVRKRILVTGGAGFVGSHLVSLSIPHPHVFPFNPSDVISHYLPHLYPFSKSGRSTHVHGTMNMLGLAKRTKARFLLASTSEVYGSPEQHPQKETYWGNVNPIGPRACYDEGKRVAEALTYGYARENAVDVRVARIFNTYGPRMSPSDGRLVSNFIMHAIRGEPISIYGDGNQTRCLMYIFDLIDGLINLMNSEDAQLVDSPVNLGTTDEKSVQDWAELIIQIVDHQIKRRSNHDQCANGGHNNSPIIHLPGLPDDPPRRKPDTTKAHSILNWHPKWSAEAGLEDTVEFFLGMFHSGYVL